METMRREELKSILDHNEVYYLINVLAPEQFNKAHIPGSYNIPVADRHFIQNVKQRIVDKDAKVIVYCANFDCNASPNAAKQLDDAGFSNVVDFAGGVQVWVEAGYHFAKWRGAGLKHTDRPRFIVVTFIAQRRPCDAVIWVSIWLAKATAGLHHECT